MKKIIFTVAVGGGECFKRCVESQRKYADRVGADFLVHTEWKYWNDDLQTDSDKRHIVELLKEYDKVLYLDADVFVNDEAIDIFLVHEKYDDFVIYNEVMFNDVNMDTHIEKLIKKHGIEKWGRTDGHYDWLNAGVMLLTKGQGHERAFHYDKDEFFKFEDMPMIYDMPYMNYNIFKYDIKVKPLHENYNTMVYFHDTFANFLHFANVLDRDDRILKYV